MNKPGHKHSVWAVIPVKSLAQSKSRLASFLSPGKRAELTLYLLQRLLRVLANVSEIETILVVSRDTAVQKMAAELGALVINEPDGGGLNKAVTAGRDWAARMGAQSTLVLPSDLPFVGEMDVKALLEETNVSSNMIVLCSDRHEQGTNALLLPAHGPFQFQYGPNSYQCHCREADRQHLPYRPVRLPGLQFDLDTQQDWTLFQAHWLTTAGTG